MNKRLRKKKLIQLKAIELSLKKLLDIQFLESETPHDERLKEWAKTITEKLLNEKEKEERVEND